MLCSGLTELEESPWAEYNYGGKPLNKKQLASLLKPFGIRSKDLRIDGENRKGYEAADFQDAWERWLPPTLPPETAPQTRQPRQTATDAVSDETANPRQVPHGGQSDFPTLASLVTDVAGKAAIGGDEEPLPGEELL